MAVTNMHEAIASHGFISTNKERTMPLGEIDHGDLLRKFYIGNDGLIHENTLSDEIIIESIDIGNDTVTLITGYYHNRDHNNPCTNVYSTISRKRLYAEYTK